MTSLYLHIPFCVRKCRYCSFSSYAGCEHLYERYCAALQRDIGNGPAEERGKPLHTLFVGGGTPTVLGAEQLTELITVCRRVYGFAAGAEISCEANPGTVDRSALDHLRRGGFNRLSLGVQSFHDDDLAVLGRIHGAAAGSGAVLAARQAGFTNVSIDLMYGLPGQTASAWRENLERAVALQPEHLSLYQLTIEEGTALAVEQQHKGLSLPDEEVVLEMDEMTAAVMAQAGYRHYETSNFARPGFECRHNLVYWHNEAYLGCGAGAVGYRQGVRRRLLADPRLYCERIEQGGSIVADSERLEPDAAFRETVIMGLRLREGVSHERLRRRFGKSCTQVYGDTLTRLIGLGLLRTDRHHLCLTAQGRRLANTVMAALV